MPFETKGGFFAPNALLPFFAGMGAALVIAAIVWPAA